MYRHALFLILFFYNGSFLFNIKDDNNNNKRKGLHAQTVGREANSAQSCDDGIVAITEAALPH